MHGAWQGLTVSIAASFRVRIRVQRDPMVHLSWHRHGLVEVTRRGAGGAEGVPVTSHRAPGGRLGPARAYRYRLAPRRPYRTASAATGWVRVDGVAEVCRAVWLARVRARGRVASACVSAREPVRRGSGAGPAQGAPEIASLSRGRRVAW